MQPRVSVVMTVYNGMPFLPAAVDSILNQSLQDFTFIIVNDGSTDDSSAFLASLSDPRIVLHHQTNQGQQAAANFGIRQAKTEFIARMDADDISSLDRLEKQVAFLDRNPQVGLVGGQILRLGSKRAGLPSNLPITHKNIVDALMMNRHGMCNATTMFRTELFHRIGGYWKHNIAEDWDLFLRLAEISELANLADILLSTRFHTGSVNGRRIVEAQLHNEYAATLASLRKTHSAEISYDEFLEHHRSHSWPRSWMFLLDCHSIGQYRVAVADIYNGKILQGYARLGLSMLMSPSRAIYRALNMLSRKKT
jgi:glycosyltransferase involved in cell wall biosynthesis